MTPPHFLRYPPDAPGGLTLNDGLVGYWKLDKGSDSTAHDIGGTGASDVAELVTTAVD